MLSPGAKARTILGYSSKYLIVYYFYYYKYIHLLITNYFEYNLTAK